MKFNCGDIVSYLDKNNKKAYGSVIGPAYNNGGEFISHYYVRLGPWEQDEILVFHVTDIWLQMLAP